MGNRRTAIILVTLTKKFNIPGLKKEGGFLIGQAVLLLTKKLGSDNSIF